MEQPLENIAQAGTVIADPYRQQARARQYASLRRLASFADLAAMLGFVGLLLLGPARWLADFAAQVSDWWPLTAAIFVVVTFLLYLLVTLPLDYWGGHALPRQFEQSRQTVGGWLADYLKGSLLTLVVLVVAVVGAEAMLRLAGDWWWLLTALAATLCMAFFTLIFPVVLLPLFYRFSPYDGPLRSRLLELSRRAGKPVQGVYEIEFSRKTQAANAGLTGLGPTRRIIISDTMLANYSDDEIEAVMGHELGHQVYNHILIGLAIQAGLIFAGFFLADMMLRWAVPTFGYRGLTDLAALPLILLVLAALAVVTLPLFNAYSRAAESACDRYSVQLVGKPMPLGTALLKLAGQNLSEIDPPDWVKLLFYTHPPIGERLRPLGFVRKSELEAQNGKQD